MKLVLAILAVLFMAAPTLAADVTLAWDANNPTPDGYRLFMRVDGQSYDYTNPAWQGPETTCTIADLAEGTTYAFVVRAFDGGLESGDSNEVVWTPEEAPETIVYPKRPKQLIINFE